MEILRRRPWGGEGSVYIFSGEGDRAGDGTLSEGCFLFPNGVTVGSVRSSSVMVRVSIWVIGGRTLEEGTLSSSEVKGVTWVFNFLIRISCLRSPTGRSNRLFRAGRIGLTIGGVESIIGGVGPTTGGIGSTVGGIGSIAEGVGLTVGSVSKRASESDGIKIGRGPRVALFFRRGRRTSSGIIGSSSAGAWIGGSVM